MLYDAKMGADLCRSLGLGVNTERTNPEQKKTGFSISLVCCRKFERPSQEQRMKGLFK
jgi:hypothetical protein